MLVCLGTALPLSHETDRTMGNSSSASQDSNEPPSLGSLRLGPPPADWDDSKDSKQHAAISGRPSKQAEHVLSISTTDEPSCPVF